MIICSDDFGLRDDINRAILELCRSRKLSAVSCMVALERCSPGSLKDLLACQNTVDIGLHLCLTDEALPLCPRWTGAPKTLPPYVLLLRHALQRKINREEIALEIAGQYELFLEKSGRRPDFIDSHLHVHQLPTVREALLEFVQKLPIGSRPYVRNTRERLRELWKRRLPWVKAAFIGALGSKMSKRLVSAGISTNEGFAGIYDFRRWRNYPEYLPAFLGCLSAPKGMLVVHPGFDEDWRGQEFQTLRKFPFATSLPNRFHG
jgi:predicted glycoside hydrolase/deacetylase ChbG (UPF0249 family)